MNHRHLRGLALAALSWLVPTVALACPVCFDPNEANRNVWLGTTALLSLLPLAFIGAVVWFLRVRAKEAENDATVPSFEDGDVT